MRFPAHDVLSAILPAEAGKHSASKAQYAEKPEKARRLSCPSDSSHLSTCPQCSCCLLRLEHTRQIDERQLWVDSVEKVGHGFHGRKVRV
jgi:hypothetical protein